MTKDELNSLYRAWELRTAKIVRYLNETLDCALQVGFYNGHYCKNAQGEYERSCYPIPVISCADLCDVEVHFDGVNVTAKLNRDNALSFDYAKLDGYDFEAYGVEDFCGDFYVKGDTVAKFTENIEKSDESEIGFAFPFPADVDEKRLAELVVLLKSNGFYY